MGRKALSQFTDVLGEARFGNKRVCAEAVRASDIVDFAGHSHHRNEEALELRLSAEPFKNIEAIFVRQVNIQHHDRRERKFFALGEGSVAF